MVSLFAPPVRRSLLCAVRLFQLLALNLNLVSGRTQLNETDQNQFLINPKWFCDSTVARAKTAVPAWENVFLFRPCVVLLFLVRCVGDFWTLMKRFFAPKLGEKYRTNFIGSVHLLSLVTKVRTYQPIRLTRAVLPDQCSEMQWTQRMSLMRLQGNIVDTPRCLGSMLV